jgi:hypothetical protein
METIKVAKKEEIVLSDDERQILYQKIGQQSDFNEYHFPIFARQEKEIVEDSLNSTLPTIITILGRRVLRHPLVFPVYNSDFVVKSAEYNSVKVVETDEEEIETDVVEEIKVGIDLNIYGGDDKPSKTKLVKNIKKAPFKDIPSKHVNAPNVLDVAKGLTTTAKRGYGFELEFDHPIQAIVDKQIVQIARNQKISVGGYVIKPHPIIPQYIQNTQRENISRGIYIYKDIAVNDMYSHIPLVSEYSVMFADEADAQKELRKLFHFIKWYDFYINGSDPIVNFLDNLSGTVKSFHQKNIASAISIPQKGVRNQIPPEKLQPLLQQFLKRLSAIYPINQYNYNQIMMDLLEIAQFDLWEHVYMNGFDSEFDEKMDILIREKDRRITSIKLQNEQNTRYVLNMKYVHILQEKYGLERIKKLDLNKDILPQLKKNERDLVEFEYDKLKKVAQEKLENDCPHIQHVNNLRSMTQRDSMMLEYNQLKTFFSKKKDEKEFPICKKCDYPTICSHVIEEMELNIAKMSPKIIREKMLKYIGDASVEDKYFCKYCGEHILDVLQLDINDFMEENMPDSGERQDVLKMLIWGEVSYLIYNRIYFQNLYSVKTLVQHISDNIYEHIYDVEKKLNKAKTNTPEMIEERVRLYTTIYGLANLINLIKNNSGKLWFSDVSKSGTSKTSKKSSSEKNQKAGKIDLNTLFTQAMKILIDSKNILIRKFNVSNANLLIFLKKAYLSLVGTSWIEKIPSQSLDWLPSDPFYKYIIQTYEVFVDNPAPKTSIEYYFDKTEKELKSASGFYEFVKNPFKKIQVSKKDVIGEELFRYYWKLNFEQMFVSINNGVYKEPRYQGKFNDKQVSNDKEIILLERKIFDHFRLIYTPVYFQYPLINTRKFHNVEINMADIYDEKGRLHKWDIFVFDKKVELTKKDIIAIMGDKHNIKVKDYQKMTLVDYKCSVCSQYMSKATGRNIEGILDELDKIVNFYRYYEYRCPAPDKTSEIHEWSDGDSNDVIICKKCHISKEQFQKHDPAYYKKYVGKYDKREVIFEYTEPEVPKKQNLTTFVNKWNFNSNTITELAKISDKKYNVLANLGFTEGIEYSELVNGTSNPSLKLKPTKYHMNRISGYINMLIREYNILKERSYVRTVPAQIKTMIKDYQYKPEDLPNILVEYKEHIDEFKHNVQKGFYFVMDSLYKTIYLMLKSSKNNAVLKVFGEYILEKIMLSDMLFSKPREAYLGLIADKGADDDKFYESDTDDDPLEEVDGFDYTPEEGEAEDQEYQGDY